MVTAALKLKDTCFYGSKRLGRKAVRNLDTLLKSRDITLPTKVHLVKVTVFPEELMLFELWCWRRLLRVPWTARRSKESILKEISPEYSLKARMLRLKLQYFGHLMRRAGSFEEILMLVKI